MNIHIPEYMDNVFRDLKRFCKKYNIEIIINAEIVKLVSYQDELEDKKNV